MKEQELKDTLKELMEKYNEYRSKWIQENGTEEGFNQWFDTQL